MRLVLFDIDGTLVDTGGAGTLSLNLAFEEIFSIADAFRGIPMAGKTDIQIMKEGLGKHGLAAGDSLLRLLTEGYLSNLRVQIRNPRKKMKPHIPEALTLLSEKQEVLLGLLTGNVEMGARIKLGAFGLNRYFPSGAFGDDDEDRNNLLPVAVERFRTLSGREIRYEECLVIGDTPRDVECAKRHGAFAVAVATGPYSCDALLNAGADRVLEDLSGADFESLLQPFPSGSV